MANITLTPEVLAVLNRSKIEGNKLVLPAGLERKLYEAVNKAIEKAGGAWNRKAQGHVFASDPRAKLGLMLETGVAIDEKKKFQAYYTPAELAIRVARQADVAGQEVLEPSAGKAALAQACLAAGAQKVDCIEVNPECATHLRGLGLPTVEADFLTVEPMRKYTRIVMNPPFARNQDIKHVAHALRFLAPGGILVAIMFPNTERNKFQKLLQGLDHTIETLPEGAFQESGTPISTVLVTVTAPGQSAKAA